MTTPKLIELNDQLAEVIFDLEIFRKYASPETCAKWEKAEADIRREIAIEEAKATPPPVATSSVGKIQLARTQS